MRVDGNIVNARGTSVPVDAVPAYLAETKPDKAATFVLWLEHPAATETAKKLVAKLADYGVTAIAVRGNRQIEPPSWSTAKQSMPDGKTAMLVGKPNPKAIGAKDTPPDVSNRPERLRPGKLVGPLRYKFVADAEVIQAAAMVEQLFLGNDPISADHAGHSLMIQSGAYARLSNLPLIAAAKPILQMVPTKDRRTVHLEGRYLATTEQTTAAIAELRHQIATEGGATLRAMRTDDMVRWWPYIGFDIEEPIFVLETPKQSMLLVVSLLHGHVFSVDDLNRLPPL